MTLRRRKDTVLDLIEQHPEWTSKEISAAANCHRHYVTDIARSHKIKLPRGAGRGTGRLKWAGRQKGATHMPTKHQSAPAADPQPGHEVKTRKCLKCRDPFESIWAGERVCKRCKGSTAYTDSGMDTTFVFTTGARAAHGGHR